MWGYGKSVRIQTARNVLTVVLASEGMENLWARFISIGNLVLSHPNYSVYITNVILAEHYKGSNSCGNMTLVQSRNSSRNVWTHTLILALKARHKISSRWLEMM